MNQKSKIIPVFFVFLFLWVVGLPKALAVFEKSTLLSTHYNFRNPGDSFPMFPGYVTGQVSVSYVVNQETPDTDNSITAGTPIRFLFTPKLPFFDQTGGAWDTPYGKWCSKLNEQCFSMTDEGSNVNISSGYEGGYAPLPIRLFWTGTTPTVRIISDAPSVVSCPVAGAVNTVDCLAVGQGTAKLTAVIDLTPLRFWLQVYNRFDRYSYPWFTEGGGYNATDIFVRPPQPGFTLFPNTEDSNLVDVYNNETRVRVTPTPIDEYLKYIDTLDQKLLSDWFIYLSQNGSSVENTADMVMNEYYNKEHVAFDPFLTKLPLGELDNLIYENKNNTTSFKDAIVRRYAISVPMVTEYTPNNQTNSIFLPKTTLGPWTITVKAPETSNKPPDLTVSATPLSVKIGQDSTITMTADDLEGDEVKYCVSWNDNDSYDEKATASTDFVQDEGCFPSIGFAPNKESREVKQSWRSIGDKKVRAIAFDDKGNKSDWKEVIIKVEDNSTSCVKSNGGVEVCDGKDNDCNGIVDDGNPGGGGQCTASGLGQCRVGINQCIGGNLLCVGAAPSQETCGNGIDEDCDGSDLSCPVTPPSTPKCNNNNRCETYKGENPVNCPKDCPSTIKETQAPKPSFWAFVLGALGFR